MASEAREQQRAAAKAELAAERRRVNVDEIEEIIRDAIVREREFYSEVVADVLGDAPLNFSKRKLGRRDATGFKELPHPDDFLLWQIAMSVRECSRTSIEHHADSVAGLIVHLCPQVLQEMYDLFEINIRTERVSK